MKKIFVLCLALVLALSLAACGGTDSSIPSGTEGNSSTPGTSQNGGGNDAGNLNTFFTQGSGYLQMPAFPDSEVSFDRTGNPTITFTAKSDITDETFLPYAREVFDVCKAASPDGVYDIDYDGYKKGADVPAFPESNWEGYLMSYWYYTNGDYIAQMYLSVEGKTLTIKINSVYNADSGERAKP